MLLRGMNGDGEVRFVREQLGLGHRYADCGEKCDNLFCAES